MSAIIVALVFLIVFLICVLSHLKMLEIAQLRSWLNKEQHENKQLREELDAIKKALDEDYGFKFDGNIADATLHFVDKLYVENEQIPQLREDKERLDWLFEYLKHLRVPGIPCNRPAIDESAARLKK